MLVQLHFRVFWFTGLFNTFLLFVLFFDLMLGIREKLILIVVLLNIFLYLCFGGKYLFIKRRESSVILVLTNLL